MKNIILALYVICLAAVPQIAYYHVNDCRHLIH